jgi:hypothetical protein
MKTINKIECNDVKCMALNGVQRRAVLYLRRTKGEK